jgi:hypothetical protein
LNVRRETRQKSWMGTNNESRRFSDIRTTSVGNYFEGQGVCPNLYTFVNKDEKREVLVVQQLAN